MAQLGYRICGIGIAAGTGVSSVAVSGTGRSSDHSGVLVTLGGNHFLCSQDLAAGGTVLAFGFAVGGAGGVYGPVDNHCVTADTVGLPGDLAAIILTNSLTPAGAVGGITGGSSNILKYIVAKNRRISQEGDLGQFGAIIEHRITNIADGSTDLNLGQAGANSKCAVANGGDRTGDHKVGQSVAAGKGPLTNGGERIGKGNTGQSGAAAEGCIANGGQRIRQLDGGHAGASVEGIIANAGSAVFNGHGQNRRPIAVPGGPAAGTVVGHSAGAGDGEGTFLGQNPGQILAAAAAGQGVDNGIGHPGHGSAVILENRRGPAGILGGIMCRCGDCREGLAADIAGNAAFKGDIRQADAGHKRIFTNVGYRFGKGDAGQFNALGKSILADIGDGTSKGKAGHGVATGES